jgi:hypothetical protein
MPSSVDTTPPTERFQLPRRGPWIALLSVLVIGAMPWLVCPRLKAWRARRDATEALSQLSGCLFGAAGDRSETGLRARTITASLEPQTDGDDWPVRCSAHAAALQVALHGLHQSQTNLCEDESCCLGDERCAELASLRHLLDRLRATLRERQLPPGLLTSLFDHAAALGLHVETLPVRTAPPDPAALPSPLGMAPLVRGRYDQRLTATVDPAGLRLAFHERAKQITLCDVQLAEATARCSRLSPSVPVAGPVQLPDQAQGGPPYLVAQPTAPAVSSAAGAVYRADRGERMWELPLGALGSYGWADGSVTTLARDAATGEAAVVHHQIGRDNEGTPIALPAALAAGPRLEGDTILWLTSEPEGSHQLHSSRLMSQHPRVGETVDLGSTGPLAGSPQLETCHLGATLAVLVRGESKGYDTAVALALRGKDGWSPVHRTQVPSPRFGFTCHGDTASLSWTEARGEQPDQTNEPQPGSRPVQGNYLAARTSCSHSGCQSSQATVALSRWSRASRYVIANLGEGLVLLWRSPLGDTRSRGAAPAGLAEVRPRVLFDDAEHLGFAWEQAGSALLVQGRRALLLVETDARAVEPATYGFVLDETGQARPLVVTQAAP